MPVIRSSVNLSDYSRGFITGQNLYFWVNPNRLTSASSAMSKDAAYAVPIIISNTITIKVIGTVITANATSTGVLRFGIYYDNANYYPGKLLVDGGTILADSGATIGKSVTLNPSVTLTPGLYWFVCVAQIAAGPIISVMNALSDVHIPHASPPALTSEQRTCYVMTSTSGALPATWTVSYTSVASSAPCMYIQVA